MHQAGMVATDDKHPGDDVLLADVVLENVFDGNASGTRQLGGALAHSIAKRFGKSRIVEDPDLPRRKKSRHSLRVTGVGLGDDLRRHLKGQRPAGDAQGQGLDLGRCHAVQHNAGDVREAGPGRLVFRPEGDQH
jgi:hypothetical protein